MIGFALRHHFEPALDAVELANLQPLAIGGRRLDFESNRLPGGVCPKKHSPDNIPRAVSESRRPNMVSPDLQ